MASSKQPKGEKRLDPMAKKKPMYYQAEDDLNLMRDSDTGGMNSGDPFDSDGYALEDDRGLAGDDEGTDPWTLPGEEGKDMPPSAQSRSGGKSLLTRLRKRNMPGRES